MILRVFEYLMIFWQSPPQSVLYYDLVGQNLISLTFVQNVWTNVPQSLFIKKM